MFTVIELSSENDWQSLTVPQVINHGGAGLLGHFKGSLLKGTVLYSIGDSVAILYNPIPTVYRL
jgi:hypothetical protein